MSDRTLDPMNQNDPRKLETANELRSDLGNHMEVVWESIAVMLAIAERDGGPMLIAASRVADEIGDLKLKLQELETTNRRRHTRVRLDTEAECSINHETHSCVVANMGVSGAAISPRFELSQGDRLTLNVAEIGTIACEVISLSESLMHVRFTDTEGSVKDAIADHLQSQLNENSPDGSALQIASDRVAEQIGNLRKVLHELEVTNRRRPSPAQLEMRGQCIVGKVAHNCAVAHISVSGAALSPRLDAAPGDEIKLNLDGIGEIDCDVVKLSEGLTHVRFDDDGRVQDAIANLLQAHLSRSTSGTS